jgi:hypothetical protein
MYVKRQGRIFLIPSCIKLWFISPDRLAVIITDYPQIQFNRTEPRNIPSHLGRNKEQEEQEQEEELGKS